MACSSPRRLLLQREAELGIHGLPLDMRQDIRTADIGTSLRAGTTALALAYDTVRAGSAGSVLVAAADMRLGAPAG